MKCKSNQLPKIGMRAIAVLTALAIPLSSVSAQGAQVAERQAAVGAARPIVASLSAGQVTPSSLPARTSATGSTLVEARPAVLPVVAAILALIVRSGLKQAVKVFGQVAVRKALRSKLLSLNANQWAHILAPKHNWHKLGAAGDRGKVANLLSDAVTRGKQYPRGTGAYEYRWTTRGQTVVAVVSKRTGEVSNGWVK